MTKMNRRQFAQRFSLEDWQLVCGDPRFVAEFAKPDPDWAVLETIAWCILQDAANALPCGEAAWSKPEYWQRVQRHLTAIAEEIEAESVRRGGDWGKSAIAAIRQGRPRWQHLHEACRRADADLAAA